MKRKKTAVLKIRYHIVYFPFVIFNVLSICHLLYDFVKDIILAINAISGKQPLIAEHHTPLTEEDEEKMDSFDTASTAEKGGNR